MCPESYGVTPHTYMVTGFRGAAEMETFRWVSVSRTRRPIALVLAWIRRSPRESSLPGRLIPARICSARPVDSGLALTRGDGGIGTQRVDLVRDLPRHAQVVAAEVPV